MTQWQQDGYAQLVTLKQIAVMERLAPLIQLKQRRELKQTNLGWLKTNYFACLAIQASISSG
jgi:hypothetical protein